jgi:hypothetical protein
MAGSSEEHSVTCCFCGQALPLMRAARLVVGPPGVDDESQTLYCHSRCLVERLDARVPHHPGLDEDEAWRTPSRPDRSDAFSQDPNCRG